MITSRLIRLAIPAVIVATVAAACGSSSKSPTATTGAGASTTAAANVSGTLNGSGSTFQAAYNQVAIQNFQQKNSGATINYQGKGSGAGQTDLANQVVQFAGSDVPVPAASLSSFKGGSILYFPTVLGPITVSYNLSGVKTLKLSPPTIAKIFSLKITNWNDPAIASDGNSGLPNLPITVVHRSDSSGTTANFTAFLVKADATDWTLGTGKTINWAGNTVAGNGNSGVASAIKGKSGAIGYVDYSDAVKAKLTFASIKNKAGEFEAPSLAGASKAVAGATIAPDLTYNALNVAGTGVYPITAGTWMLVYVKQTKHNVGEALKSYINYLVTDGQKLAEPSNYAPLPTSLAQQAVTQLDKLQIPAS